MSSGLERCLIVKSTGHSSEGARFGSQGRTAISDMSFRVSGLCKHCMYVVHRHTCKQNSYMERSGARELAHCINVPAAKADSLSLIPGTNMAEGKSNFFGCPLASVCVSVLE